MEQKANVFLWPDRALYIGPSMETTPHSHHALQLSIGLQQELSFHNSSNNVFAAGRLLLIASDTSHNFHAPDQNIAFLYLDSETNDAISIKNELLQGNSMIAFGVEIIKDLLPLFDDPLLGCKDAEFVSKTLIGRIVPKITTGFSIDPRVAAVLEELDRNEGESASVAELAQSVGLSTSRLCHVFQEQIGFPIRRYFLWKKLIRAIMALESADTLTAAAHSAGFSDSAHMNRTFRKMFGIKPSFFLNYREYVHIHTCSP